MSEDIILEARNITKVYPGTIALMDVNFLVRRGKVNVLIGENGAGKSTLMKIIAGVEVATSGSILIEGKEVHYQSPADALKNGVGIIYQELNLFPNLSIAENIFMTHERMINPVYIDHKQQIEEAKALLEKLQLHINPTTLVKDLRIGQQQIIEIAKVLSENAKIIIMDEPTSALSQEEVSVLFGIIEELKSQGVSIIYISHRLEEIFHIGDYITILRDGKFIAEDEVKNIDLPWIINKMTGGNTVEHIDSGRKIGEVLLEVENLSLPKGDGKYILKDISFKLHKHEILGIYGLRGAGRTELLECLIGAHEEALGIIKLEGKPLKSKTIGGRIREGLALIPEDRKNEGIFTNLDVLQNMTISSLRSFVKWITLKPREEEEAVESMISGLKIKVPNHTIMIKLLSGGNQQKVVIGKSLLTNLKVLLMDEPTRGIDIASKHDVFNICESLAQKGLGIIFVSSEMQEMLSIPDRILVLSEGRLKGEFLRSEVTEEKLVRSSAIDLTA
jgi:erythritol transport system ATP-binding protein